MAAVMFDGRAFCFAADELRADPTIALAAVRSTNSIHHVQEIIDAVVGQETKHYVRAQCLVQMQL